jgi:ABC-type microcin C transport system permease subunit YejE
MRSNTIMWSAGRHPAPLAAVHCHPELPLVLSASRWGAARLRFLQLGASAAWPSLGG